MISFLVSHVTVSIIQYRRLRYVDVAIMCWIDLVWISLG